MERLYSCTEAAEMLGIKMNTLRAWIQKRRISYKKVGRFIRFTEDDIKSAIKPITFSK